MFNRKLEARVKELEYAIINLKSDKTRLEGYVKYLCESITLIHQYLGVERNTTPETTVLTRRKRSK